MMNNTSTLPPQAAQTTASSSVLPSPSTPKLVGFINDKFSSKCQQIQRRRFLKSGIQPCSGQRIELNIILSSDGLRGSMPFRLSGEVVSACEPVMSWRQHGSGSIEEEKEDDTNNTADGASNSILCQPCSTSTFRPSTSAEDCGVGKGSVVLASMIQSILSDYNTNQQSPSPLLTGRQLNTAWNIASYETKKKVTDSIVSKLGALHGQRIVCEGRLNFDYDKRRGTEEGPWVDGIPFDGRDVWGFTLVCDDSLENMWRVDPLSFVNLGSNHRPRCWPWSDSDVLPFERLGEGNDAPLIGPGPNGAISRTLVLVLLDVVGKVIPILIKHKPHKLELG